MYKMLLSLIPADAKNLIQYLHLTYMKGRYFLQV